MKKVRRRPALTSIQPLTTSPQKKSSQPTMSIYLPQRTVNDLHDVLEHALEISAHLDGVLSEKRHILRSKRKLLAAYPELHPANRARLDPRAVQRGGALYRPGRRYVGMCRLLRSLADEEQILAENRLVCIRFERDLRRHVTADYEEGVRAGFVWAEAGY